jgi:subtilisin family serine protease
VLKAQVINPAYRDGKIYVKCKPWALKACLGDNPKNLSFQKINFLSDLVSVYGIQKVSRPFFQAGDDANLPFVLRVEFSVVQKTEELLSVLQKIPAVEYAEKIPLARIDAVPNDPLFVTAGGGNHLNQINAPNAWNLSTGNPSITVAIIDNAVMWSHADLVANTYTNAGEIANNGIDDDNNGYVDDRNGFDVADYDNNAIPTNTNMNHGTHCAGIAAATTNNGIGIAGIGWNIKFIPVKCEPDNGSVSNVTFGFEGIIYATKAKAKVISCSWTNFSTTPSITEQAVIDYAWNHGCIVVACAGNFSSSTPYYPGAYTNVYCVAAVTNADILAPYSNYGTWVDVAAPGTTINSTVPYVGSALYQQQSGTSMATPLVAGLAGLILSYAPNMSRTNVLNCISSSATNVYTLSGNSAYVSGNMLGAGRIDAYGALLCASAYTAHIPQANFYAFPKNTCPNTTVQFYDSSVYAPTSWNWVFQGGSPGTSTLANPQVMWSSPGTYSVFLSATNASGSHNITKQSYISINTAQSLTAAVQEGFENTAFLPLGWTENNITNDNMRWQRKTGLSAFGIGTACAMFDNNTYIVAGDRDEIRSPRFNFSNVAKVKLRFDVAYAKYDDTFSDSLEIKMSTTCGQSWTTIYYRGGNSFTTCPDYSSGTFVPNAGQWRTDSIDVSAAAGQNNVLFSFVNHGHFGQPIYLDNVNLFFPAPNLAISFNSVACVTSPVNYSYTASGGVNYQWQFQSGTPATSGAGSVSVNYANVGTFTINLSASNGPVQSSVIGSVSVINASQMVTGTTVINAGCYTCTDGVIQLNTNGSSSLYTFSWTPNVSSASSASNLVQGNYTVQVRLGSCVNTQVLVVGFPDALREINERSMALSVYPNPGHDQLMVDVQASPYTLRLINAMGEVVYSGVSHENQFILHINQFVPGVYFIETTNNNTISRKKVIFNK